MGGKKKLKGHKKYRKKEKRCPIDGKKKPKGHKKYRNQGKGCINQRIFLVLSS